LGERLVFLGFLLGVSLLVLTVPAFAGNPAVIDVTVSTELISLSVTPTSVDYGTLGLGVESDLSDELQISNNGTVNEDFRIKGANASTPPGCSGGECSNWRLWSSNVADSDYIHKWVVPPYGDGNKFVMTLDYQAAFSGVIPSNSEHMKLQLTTPQRSAGMGTYETTVTVQATVAGS